MWEIQATYKSATDDARTVVVIDHYYDPDEKLLMLIALDRETGNFITGPASSFQAMQKDDLLR